MTNELAMNGSPLPPGAPDPPPRLPPGRHGAVLRSAAVAALGVDEVLAGLDDGRWVELWKGVLVPAERVDAPITRGSAALLRAGPEAVLSGLTALAAHGCAPPGRVVHLTLPYGHDLRRGKDLVLHHRAIRETEVVELDGLRVEALDVALAEQLCRGPGRLVLDCLERAMREVGASAERFRESVRHRLNRRNDRRGTRRALELLDLAWTAPPVLVQGPIAGAGAR
ncbi:hypothetical protein [Saccharopolyspora sp. CA-218241]|uniref:hypothetical protein n=1 Tax=Saccharopolyspora sp. CA-218241 TaxID=3240027 RepID=UPI003D979FBE